MRTFHANWAYVVVGLNLVVGVWGIGWVRRSLPTPSAFWPLTYAGQGAIAVQAVLGTVLHQDTPAPTIHVFYGFVVLIAAAVAWAFRSRDEQRNVTIFSAIAIFVAAVSGIRGIPTA